MRKKTQKKVSRLNTKGRLFKVCTFLLVISFIIGVWVVAIHKEAAHNEPYGKVTNQKNEYGIERVALIPFR